MPEHSSFEVNLTNVRLCRLFPHASSGFLLVLFYLWLQAATARHLREESNGRQLSVSVSAARPTTFSLQTWICFRGLASLTAPGVHVAPYSDIPTALCDSISAEHILLKVVLIIWGGGGTAISLVVQGVLI